MTDSSRTDRGDTGVWNVSLGDWDTSLETGMELIDRQHQALFEQIRVLLDRSKGDRIEETLKFMANYAVEHFNAEEEIHRETDYPRTEEHYAEHNRFVAAFTELKREYDDSGHSLTILMKITKFFLAWLQEHIRGHDQKFAEYFHQFRPIS